MNFPNLKHITLKLKQRQFKAFYEHITEVYEHVNETFYLKNSSESLQNYIIYDFVHTKITASLIISWSNKNPEKYYNYQLPLSVAIAVIESIQAANKDNYFLSEFLWALVNRTQPYLAESRLDEKSLELYD